MASLLQHSALTNSFKCRGCYEVHEIPRAAQRNPETFAIFHENLEQLHAGNGCREAAEIVEALAFKSGSERMATIKLMWGDLVRKASNATT